MKCHFCVKPFIYLFILKQKHSLRSRAYLHIPLSCYLNMKVWPDSLSSTDVFKYLKSFDSLRYCLFKIFFLFCNYVFISY